MTHAAPTISTPLTSPASVTNERGSKQEFPRENGNDKLFPLRTIQRKLAVTEANDPHEKEADDMADKVMRMSIPEPISFSTSKNIVSRKCSECEKEEELQRKESHDETASFTSSIVQDVLNSPGRSLDTGARSFMEPRFNYDFSNVKIHDNELAAKSADSINAFAYTSGNNIVFNSGQYDTSSDSGKRLLAHELTHVVQQNNTISAATLGNAKSIVQKFGATEHKISGDESSKKFSVNNQPLDFSFPSGKVSFVLTFGDITMLSADLFDPRDTITGADGKQHPNPDSLFLIASRPSSNPGLEKNTQDEIIFAIYDADKTDPRFQKGGIWESLPAIFESKDPKTNEYLSKDVRKAVNDRYLKLASKNYEHFVMPTGKDLGPTAGLGISAGGSYRVLHEDAIKRAYAAGQQGQSSSEALMREAAAHHFLQDAFAAGHIRSPRQSIDEYWLKKYPLFFENMKKKMALDMARYMNEHYNNTVTVFGTVTQIYDSIYADLQKQAKDLPPIGFGAVVGETLHYFDNEEGLWVKNQLGHSWLDFGDSNLFKTFQLNKKETHKYANNQTAAMIRMAEELGIGDILQAFEFGKIDKGLTPSQSILDDVRKKGTDKFNKPTTLYAPEMVFPQLDTSANNGNIAGWQAASVDELWTNLIRTDKPQTYGQLITQSLLSGNLNDQLSKMADTIPAKTTKYGSDLFPREAFREGFFKPLQQHPLARLKAIIDYNPSEGQAFFNEDDAVIEEISTMGVKEQKGFTLKQRADRIKSIVDCDFCVVTYDEGEVVIKLFATAELQERTKLYQLVEGHAWKGDWKRGAFVSDDLIWNGLDTNQLKRLRKIINGN